MVERQVDLGHRNMEEISEFNDECPSQWYVAVVRGATECSVRWSPDRIHSVGPNAVPVIDNIEETEAMFND